jgi:hypothetical protein
MTSSAYPNAPQNKWPMWKPKRSILNLFSSWRHHPSLFTHHQIKDRIRREV